MKNNQGWKKTVFAGLLLCMSFAHADVTDISDTPLASSSDSVVKPNVMFILDDSGSMAWDYLPDVANFSNGTYGEKSSHCNGVYFNPAVTYKPPVNAAGDSFPDANFRSALPDGFRAATSGWNGNNNPVDLNNSIYYVYGSPGTQPDLGYAYNSRGNAISNDFYKECASDIGDSPGKGKFTKVTVSTSSTASLRTNFANWYSYYRTRMLAMKTSAGLAFQSISDNYRIGYTTHSYTGTDSNNSEFLKIDDFTFASDGSGQKNKWYAKLYGARPTGGTPLRAALSKVGRMYAGKLLTGSSDPVQYSCQQNFALLATDGYWNGDAGYKIDGSSAIGNQDGGTTARPMFDGLDSSNSLADVAMYYYKTDLRADGATGALGNGIDVGKNNVPGSRADIQLQQHMTTFTLGLGLNGTLQYSANYLSGGSADYNAILQGTKNWPIAVADSPTAIDDLWHAAVNGRGTYFSAQNSNALVTGLSKALAGVSARTGAAASAATSTLEPVAGDNQLFVALYRTVKWDGDLQAKTIDPTTGEVSDAIVWSGQAQLDQKVAAASDTRTIYTYDSGATSKLKTFSWAALSNDEKAYFKNKCADNLLSQCPDLADDAARTKVDAGETLVNFLRGQSGSEDQTGNTDLLYRDREHVLGDMVGAQPVYVKKPTFPYLDENYASFRDVTQANRAATVYAAANDGMLHAFDATTGVERWAYIPPMVLPNLYKLADKNYASKHQYYVDGSPSVGDICPNAPTSTCQASEWKTILVGGLNKGGKGYYALDITNPGSPKALWNFTDADDEDMGLSYGNPIITKRADGTWVVALTSGYNNTSGDGKGHLYLLNANTGRLLLKLDTTAGSSGSPSGLAKINGWVDTLNDNTVKRFYGGDLLGNVWRFDTDNLVLPDGAEATLLAQVGNVGTVGIQPITTRPLLSEIEGGGNRYAVVTVGTGRYLGDSDRNDKTQQSIYAIKDKLTDTGYGRLRLDDTFVQQTLTTNDAGTERAASDNAVNWITNSGWYVDLNPNNESPGERINVDMQQQLGVLAAAGNVPENNACTVGGYAWLYFFDFRTGSFIDADGTAGQRLAGNSLVAGLRILKLDNGKTTTLVTDTSGKSTPQSNPESGSGGEVARRISWQELIVD